MKRLFSQRYSRSSAVGMNWDVMIEPLESRIAPAAVLLAGENGFDTPSSSLGSDAGSLFTQSDFGSASSPTPGASLFAGAHVQTVDLSSTLRTNFTNFFDTLAIGQSILDDSGSPDLGSGIFGLSNDFGRSTATLVSPATVESIAQVQGASFGAEVDITSTIAAAA